MRAGDVVLDVPRMRVTVGERPVELTSTEFALLATLMRQPGRVFTRAQLLDAIHGVDGRGVRARRRRARQEPAPQDRAGSARAALRADGLRRRLPVRRRMSDRGTAPPGRPAVAAASDAVGRRAARPPVEAQARARFFRRVVVGVLALVAAGRLSALASIALARWPSAPGSLAVRRRAGRAGGAALARSASPSWARDAARRRRAAAAPSWMPPIASPTATTPSASASRPAAGAGAGARLQRDDGAAAGADRQRRDLMADVAHELRTPLSVLQGTLEGLLDGVYPRDDRQLAALLEETQVLSRLIEDLRTLAPGRRRRAAPGARADRSRRAGPRRRCAASSRRRRGAASRWR